MTSLRSDITCEINSTLSEWCSENCVCSVPHTFSNETLNPYGQDKDDSLISTVIINLVLAGIIFILFLISKYFRSRLYALHPDHKPPQGHFTWIWHVITKPSEELLESHGLDVVTYVQFLIMCTKIILVLMIYGILIILPVNYSASNKDQSVNSTYYVSGSNVLTIANIPDKDEGRFICHAIGILFNNATVMYFLYSQYREMVRFKIKDVRKRKDVENYTVTLMGFNENKWDAKSLEKFFDRLFPDMVLAVHVVPSIPHLENLHKRRFNLVKLKEEKVVLMKKKKLTNSETLKIVEEKIRKIDEKIAQFVDGPHSWTHYPTSRIITEALPRFERFNVALSKKTKGTSFSKAPKKAKKIFHVVDVVADVVETPRLTITNQDKRVPTLISHSTNIAYVTFRSKLYAHTCARIIAGKTPKWRVAPAPDQRDIFWSNHTPNFGSIRRTSWFLLGVAIEFFLVLFWIIPITFSAVLSNLTYLSNLTHLPIDDWLGNYPTVKSVISGIVPQVVILLCFILLLPLIRFLVNLTAIPINRTSKIQYIMVIYFIFKVVNIYCTGILVNTFVGIFAQLRLLIQQPFLIIRNLGYIVPAQAIFLMNFVMTSALRESMLRLWRPWSLLSECCGLCCCAVTPRDYRRLYKPEVFEYYEAYPDKVFILVITICYSNIAPIILGFGLVYFCLMYCTESYRLLFVCQSKSHSGGLLWTTAFNEICFGLVLYNATMMGVLLLKNVFGGAVIGFVMIFVAGYFCYYMNAWWYPILYYGPLEVLVDNDEIISPDNEVFRKAYCHPALLPVKARKKEWYGDDDEKSVEGKHLKAEVILPELDPEKDNESEDDTAEIDEIPLEQSQLYTRRQSRSSSSSNEFSRNDHVDLSYSESLPPKQY